MDIRGCMEIFANQVQNHAEKKAEYLMMRYFRANKQRGQLFFKCWKYLS